MTKILLAEDHADNREMLTRRLERRGYVVVCAENGAEAVALALSERPDVILMDISMPVLSGLEATQALRARPETLRTPIIALTAHAMAHAEQAARAAGCDAFATKPVDFAALVTLINGFSAQNPPTL